MLTGAQLTTAMNRMIQTPQPMVLYHGTNTASFYSKLCLRTGFESNQAFMGAYSLASLGGTAVYGPGLYLADTRAEALNYGNLIVKVEFEANTNYMELFGHARNANRNAIGASMQNILSEPQLYGLLKVTANYYVMRTPFNCVIGAG